MSMKTAKAYEERFERVLKYVDRHLDDVLTVERLSKVANFSRFHFHRQFSEFAGMTVSRYIQMMRLRRASYQLVFKIERRIIDVALEAGFENPESFTRAFKRHFGQTPSQFRNKPAWKPWNERMQLPKRERSEMMDVKIVDFDETMIAVKEHRGDPQQVNESVKEFIEWRKSTGLSPVDTSRTFGIPYDDPEVVESDRFCFDICGSVLKAVPENPQKVVNKVIPGGRCAVLRHYGSTDIIKESVYYLYREWLPESGEELRDFPVFFNYLKLMPETPEHELITDIYLPMK